MDLDGSFVIHSMYSLLSLRIFDVKVSVKLICCWSIPFINVTNDVVTFHGEVGKTMFFYEFFSVVTCSELAGRVFVRIRSYI